MMPDRFLEKAAQLSSRGEPFAMAIVVKHTPPISVKTGDKAVILPDGTVWGWRGGGCSWSILVQQALDVLKQGRSRLIRVSPDSAESGDSPTASFAMNCQSGGAMEIYIEPVLPRPRILIFGSSPVAKALAVLGRVLDFQISVVASESAKKGFPEVDDWLSTADVGCLEGPAGTFVVVATQGDGDLLSLEQAVRLETPYLSFVASRNKAMELRKLLEKRGIPQPMLDRIKAPAGLDIQARTPEEIALSILAEIIQVRGRRLTGAVVTPEAMVQPESMAVDPVCGMKVIPETARFQSTYKGNVHYFCGDGCKRRFELEPEWFLGARQITNSQGATT